MFTLSNIIGSFVLITGLIFIIKCKSEDEPYYILKAIGYIILGGFRFTYNNWHIPLGFILFLLIIPFHSPDKNQRGKRYAACLGLVLFITNLAVPAAQNVYYERSRHIEATSYNIYDFDFIDNWEKVQKVLDMDEYEARSAVISDFRLFYHQSGEIEDFSYNLMWNEHNSFRHARIDYYYERKEIGVRAQKISQWLQNDGSINTATFFEKLRCINFKSISNDKKFSHFSLWYYGYSSFAIENGKKYELKDKGFKPYSGTLPVKCHWFQFCGQNMINGSMANSPEDQEYILFDLSYD